MRQAYAATLLSRASFCMILVAGSVEFKSAKIPPDGSMMQDPTSRTSHNQIIRNERELATAQSAWAETFQLCVACLLHIRERWSLRLSILRTCDVR